MTLRLGIPTLALLLAAAAPSVQPQDELTHAIARFRFVTKG